MSGQIEHVERFVSTVDDALRQRDNQHQLLSLATARIESYDAIEPPNDECVKVRRCSSNITNNIGVLESCQSYLGFCLPSELCSVV